MDQISRDGSYGVPKTRIKKISVCKITVESDYTQLISGGR